MYNRKININEIERKKIQKLYGINKTDYVFDFVLTENHKYVILMDQVFVEGGNGKSIGSIWDNTYIFNEIIKENLNKLGHLVESKENINEIIDNFVWEKELVNEILKSKEIIEEGIWDSIKNMGSVFLKKGVIPFLQWIRRGLYTNAGIVIDVVVSILAVKTNAVIWLFVVLLDVYEIITGEFDPKDPDRKESPYLFLVCDLMAVVFTSAVSSVFKGSIKAIRTKGVKALSKEMTQYLRSLYTKIPTIKTAAQNAGKILSQKFGKGSFNVINIILNGVDKILTGVQTFLHKLLSVEGVKAVATGGAVLGGVEAVKYGINKVSDNQNSKIINSLQQTIEPEYEEGVDF